MPNHIHLLWEPIREFNETINEFALLSFTAHEFKKHLIAENNWIVLNNYKSTQNDRKFHFWERRARTIEIKNYDIAIQKLEYIHNNPCKEKWNLGTVPNKYFYSSANFYETEIDAFGFIQHISSIV